jgi:CubicO group peptidase (beta-lactamase class C family)
MAVSEIDRILQAAVAEGAAPGFTAAVASPEGTRLFAAGVRGAADATPMDERTIFWIASCTKAIVSAAALELVDQGKLDLDEPVGRLLPELAAPQVLTGFDAEGVPQLRPATQPITLRRLLTHTSGLAYDFFHPDLARYLRDRGLTLFTAGSGGVPLVFEPGEAWQYGIGIDVVGLLIEAARGRTLGEHLAETLFQPLGMADTIFDPTPEQDARRAGLHARLPDGGLAPIDPIPPSPADFRGGGGLYATAADYLKFLRAVLAGGAGVLSLATIRRLCGNETGELAAGTLVTCMPHLSNDFRPFPEAGPRWTLGFLQNQQALPGGRSAGAVAWGGLANCYYWADPSSGVAGVLFAQVLPFADDRILGVFEALERAVYAPARASAAAASLSTEPTEA